MKKRYFATKKKDNLIFRIFIGVVLILVSTYGLYRLLWLTPVSAPGKDVPSIVKDKILSRASKTKEINWEDILKQKEEKNIDEIRKSLKSYIDSSTEPDELAKAYLLWLDVEEELGNLESAQNISKEAKDRCTGAKDYAVILYRYATILEKLGKDAEAEDIYNTVVKEFSKGNKCYGYVGLARLASKRGEKVKARDFASSAVVDAEWDSKIWNEAVDLLGKLNVELIFSPEETPESKKYIVQRGDTLVGIGAKLNTPVGMLCRANGLDENAVLRPNQVLKYTPKDFRLIVERSKCRAFLVDENGIFKRYIVGLGKPGHETTLGSYKIGNKQKNPTWFKQGEGPIPPGDPRNELGTRWMPLVPAEPGLPSDLGLHGTIAPETIGTYSSNGCVRFLKDDIEELYDLIVRSTPVLIKEIVTHQDIFQLESIEIKESIAEETNKSIEK